MICTANDLIDELGGTGAIAGLFGVKDNTVSTWRVRGLPGWTCARLKELVDEKGSQVDPQLFEIKPRVRSAA